MSKATRIIGTELLDGRCSYRLSRRARDVRRIEGAAHACQHLVDLGLGDDEGRCKSDAIADHAQHEAVLAARADRPPCRRCRRARSRPGCACPDELDAGDHADAGHVADQRMTGEALRPSSMRRPSRRARALMSISS